MDDLARVRRALEATDQWLDGRAITRAAFELGDGPWRPALGARCLRALRQMQTAGEVERRSAGRAEAAEDQWKARTPVASTWS